MTYVCKLIARDFYPRPPGGGRRPTVCSTVKVVYFYPRPPGGGRHYICYVFYVSECSISIHALRVEGDLARCMRPSRQPKFLSTPSGWRATFISSTIMPVAKFLSTPSGWRATIGPQGPQGDPGISIHALRVEGDIDTEKCYQILYISIHALRVEGDYLSKRQTESKLPISIHALRVEGDR